MTPQSVLNPEIKAELRGAWPVMVRENAVAERKAVYADAHASRAIGWPHEAGRILIRWLRDFATHPQIIYSRKWRTDDLVVWDNGCVLRRAAAYDRVARKQLMQRITVEGSVPMMARLGRYELVGE